MTGGDLHALAWVVQMFMATYFAWSGVAKLRDPAEFARGVQDYRVLPDSVAAAIAPWFPVAELLLAWFWLAGWVPVATAWGTFGLLAAFTGAVVINLRRGRPLPCHCHTPLGSGTIGWGLVVRNVTLGVLCLVGVALAPWNSAPNQWAPWILDGYRFVPALLLVAFLYVTLGHLEWVAAAQRTTPTRPAQ